MKLNLGCGAKVVHGWVNVDCALGARFTKIPGFRFVNNKFKLFDLDWDPRIFVHDLAEKFPWQDNTVEAIYTSHTLEHFTREDGREFLIECYRVLRPNGIIRIVVPDLRIFVEEYLAGKFRADEFIENLGVLYGNSKNRIKNRLAHFVQIPHKCMYDTASLSRILNELGFDVVPKPPFDSEIDDIKRLELEDRTHKAVIVEGKKR